MLALIVFVCVVLVVWWGLLRGDAGGSRTNQRGAGGSDRVGGPFDAAGDSGLSDRGDAGESWWGGGDSGGGWDWGGGGDGGGGGGDGGGGGGDGGGGGGDGGGG